MRKTAEKAANLRLDGQRSAVLHVIFSGPRLLEILAQVAQKADDWQRSMNLSQRILREDPFREDVHCHLMRAHAAQGNRVAVREQYETLRKLLRKELGVEPAAETQRIYKELLK